MKRLLITAAMAVSTASAAPVYDLTEWLASGVKVTTGPWRADEFTSQLPYIQLGLDSGAVESFRWCQVGGCSEVTPPSDGYELYLFAGGVVLRGPFELAAYIKTQLEPEVDYSIQSGKLEGVEFSHGEHNREVPHDHPSEAPEPTTSALIGAGILGVVGLEKWRRGK